METQIKTMLEQELITKADAAAVLNVSKRSIENYVQRKVLRVHTYGKGSRGDIALFKYDEVQRLKEARAIPTLHQVAAGKLPVLSDGQSPARGAGYVYVLRAENGLFKIGRSRNPMQRVQELSGTTGPVEIELILSHYVADCAKSERELHAAFTDKRARGEWFALDVFDLMRIVQYGAAEQVERLRCLFPGKS